MKKILVLCILILLTFSGFIAAESIGENFEAGGIAISGSGYYYTSLEDYWSMRISPYLDFFPMDNLGVGIGFNYYTNSNDFSTKIGVDAGVSHTFGYEKSASNGLAVMVGLWYSYDMYLKYVRYSEMYITPYIRGLYFLSPRIATYITLTAIDFQYGDYITEMLDTYVNLSFGFTWYLPTKDKAIF